MPCKYCKLYRIGNYNYGNDYEKRHYDKHSDFKRISNFYELVHRFFVVFHLFYAIKGVEYFDNTIGIFELCNLNFYRIRQRIFYESIEQISIILPFLRFPLRHCRILVEIINLIDFVHSRKLQHHRLRFLICSRIFEVCGYGVKFRLRLFYADSYVYHYDEKKTEYQKHCCNRKHRCKTHRPISENLHKSLFYGIP